MSYVPATDIITSCEGCGATDDHLTIEIPDIPEKQPTNISTETIEMATRVMLKTKLKPEQRPYVTDKSVELLTFFGIDTGTAIDFIRAIASLAEMSLPLKDLKEASKYVRSRDAKYRKRRDKEISTRVAAFKEDFMAKVAAGLLKEERTK